MWLTGGRVRGGSFDMLDLSKCNKEKGDPYEV